jgi:hypothetical protein
MLADFLESDLQDSATIAEVLDLVKNSSTSGDQEISGNSCTVVVQSDRIVMENLFDEEAQPFQLSTVQARILLAGWAEFLDNDGLMSVVPVF